MTDEDIYYAKVREQTEALVEEVAQAWIKEIQKGALENERLRRKLIRMKRWAIMRCVLAVLCACGLLAFAVLRMNPDDIWQLIWQLVFGIWTGSMLGSYIHDEMDGPWKILKEWP